MTRQFTIPECAFLAWFYYEMKSMTRGERFDYDAAEMVERWQEATGETLSDDFHQYVEDYSETIYIYITRQ